MESIHLNNTLKRIAYVDDTLMAAQAGYKDVSKYCDSLRASVGVTQPEAEPEQRNDSAAFLARHPRGI